MHGQPEIKNTFIVCIHCISEPYGFNLTIPFFLINKILLLFGVF